MPKSKKKEKEKGDSLGALAGPSRGDASSTDDDSVSDGGGAQRSPSRPQVLAPLPKPAPPFAPADSSSSLPTRVDFATHVGSAPNAAFDPLRTASDAAYEDAASFFTSLCSLGLKFTPVDFMRLLSSPARDEIIRLAQNETFRATYPAPMTGLVAAAPLLESGTTVEFLCDTMFAPSKVPPPFARPPETLSPQESKDLAEYASTLSAASKLHLDFVPVVDALQRYGFSVSTSNLLSGVFTNSLPMSVLLPGGRADNLSVLQLASLPPVAQAVLFGMPTANSSLLAPQPPSFDQSSLTGVESLFTHPLGQQPPPGMPSDYKALHAFTAIPFSAFTSGELPLPSSALFYYKKVMLLQQYMFKFLAAFVQACSVPGAGIPWAPSMKSIFEQMANPVGSSRVPLPSGVVLTAMDLYFSAATSKGLFLALHAAQLLRPNLKRAPSPDDYGAIAKLYSTSFNPADPLQTQVQSVHATFENLRLNLIWEPGSLIGSIGSTPHPAVSIQVEGQFVRTLLSNYSEKNPSTLDQLELTKILSLHKHNPVSDLYEAIRVAAAGSPTNPSRFQGMPGLSASNPHAFTASGGGGAGGPSSQQPPQPPPSKKQQGKTVKGAAPSPTPQQPAQPKQQQGKDGKSQQGKDGKGQQQQGKAGKGSTSQQPPQQTSSVDSLHNTYMKAVTALLQITSDIDYSAFLEPVLLNGKATYRWKQATSDQGILKPIYFDYKSIAVPDAAKPLISKIQQAVHNVKARSYTPGLADAPLGGRAFVSSSVSRPPVSPPVPFPAPPSPLPEHVPKPSQSFQEMPPHVLQQMQQMQQQMQQQIQQMQQMQHVAQFRQLPPQHQPPQYQQSFFPPGNAMMGQHQVAQVAPPLQHTQGSSPFDRRLPGVYDSAMNSHIGRGGADASGYF